MQPHERVGEAERKHAGAEKARQEEQEWVAGSIKKLQKDAARDSQKFLAERTQALQQAQEMKSRLIRSRDWLTEMIAGASNPSGARSYIISVQADQSDQQWKLAAEVTKLPPESNMHLIAITPYAQSLVSAASNVHALHGFPKVRYGTAVSSAAETQMRMQKGQCVNASIECASLENSMLRILGAPTMDVPLVNMSTLLPPLRPASICAAVFDVGFSDRHTALLSLHWEGVHACSFVSAHSECMLEFMGDRELEGQLA